MLIILFNQILKIVHTSVMHWPTVTMATQHPDNAGVPWWRKDPFIPAQDEIEELLLLFKDLPIDEYMWDWEGKYADIVQRLQGFIDKEAIQAEIVETRKIRMSLG